MSLTTPSQNDTTTNIFAAVANPERVDMTRPRRNVLEHHSSTTPRSAIFDQMIKENAKFWNGLKPEEVEVLNALAQALS